ncbi:MAG: tRNA adenosine(34) deaminase TadA [Thiotrichales bacterium]|jgi:tRNA(adenine34) deaminase|nr:tRNA adenosine(34) deaminase TadA [Thiotrichales bacterium]MBT3613899.1 tRNA adenosine(34) deaminase TadA [Thiotrichales bacterium]MBT3752975.1 tRNA adenosine(34) deaminase TadA [Thiotrichales bacterium]MBT3836830.1 tRNA adenosine(34) deaminase TadA [Thiotrichales bacterium]MBT4151831.1 tRNA adenosine(34) deaminase TadA [Thiotrichales bacterium]
MSKALDSVERIESDEHWMRQAMLLAEQGEIDGEVPVGALLVRDGVVIGEGWNAPISLHDPSAHAEIRALRSAAAAEKNYRISNATLFVTLEPCAMCAGAIIQARIDRVVFGAREPKGGAVESQFQLLQHSSLNHHCEIRSGVLEDECGEMLRNFFRRRRA